MLRSIQVFVAVLALCCLSLPAQAVQRVFVSAISGNDANTATGCAASAPCRWFAGAITAVDPNGEIVAMDSGAYGAVTITKSVSIISAPGVYAGITVFSGNGVTIATPGVSVVLRGLTINGMGGLHGIYMTDGARLTVDRCEISNFSSGYGLGVSAAATVAVLDSLITGGYIAARFSGGATATVSRSRLLGNSNGLAAHASAGTTTVSVIQSEASGNGASGFDAYASSGGTVRLDIRDSVSTGNGGAGFYASTFGGTTWMSVSTSLASGNYYGFFCDNPSATLTASGNTVTRNTYGLYQVDSAVLESTGDNIVRGNPTATTGTITAVTKM